MPIERVSEGDILAGRGAVKEIRCLMFGEREVVAGELPPIVFLPGESVLAFTA